jgi:hypothetical protein
LKGQFVNWKVCTSTEEEERLENIFQGKLVRRKCNGEDWILYVVPGG